MKPKTRLLTIAVTYLLMNMAHADAINPDIYPLDLMYLSKPIDPLCFFSPENKDKINFTACGLNQAHYSITRIDEALTKKHYYGFEWGDRAVKYPSGGYSYYQAWYAGSRHYWIYSINSTGGSGDFTAIDLFARVNNDSGILKPLSGGDRCNGGVSDVTEKAYDIVYAVNLTAYDIYALAGNHSSQVKAYDDLSACAACCAGKAFYKADLRLKPKLLYVDVGANKRIAEMSTQGKNQACFNQLLAKYIHQGKTRLSQQELEVFSKEFNETCIKG